MKQTNKEHRKQRQREERTARSRRIGGWLLLPHLFVLSVLFTLGVPWGVLLIVATAGTAVVFFGIPEVYLWYREQEQKRRQRRK